MEIEVLKNLYDTSNDENLQNAEKHTLFKIEGKTNDPKLIFLSSKDYKSQVEFVFQLSGRSKLGKNIIHDIEIDDENLIVGKFAEMFSLDYFPNVSQRYLSVYEIMILRAKLVSKKIFKRDVLQQVESIIELLGIKNLKNKNIQRLNRFENILFQIAIYLLHDTKFLFIHDYGIEKTEKLENRSHIIRILKKVCVSRYKTIFFGTEFYDAHIFSQFDKFILLRDDQMVFYGDVSAANENILSYTKLKIEKIEIDKFMLLRTHSEKMSITDNFSVKEIDNYENIEEKLYQMSVKPNSVYKKDVEISNFPKKNKFFDIRDFFVLCANTDFLEFWNVERFVIRYMFIILILPIFLSLLFLKFDLMFVTRAFKKIELDIDKLGNKEFVMNLKNVIVDSGRIVYLISISFAYCLFSTFHFSCHKDTIFRISISEKNIYSPISFFISILAYNYIIAAISGCLIIIYTGLFNSFIYLLDAILVFIVYLPVLSTILGISAFCFSELFQILNMSFFMYASIFFLILVPNLSVINTFFDSPRSYSNHDIFYITTFQTLFYIHFCWRSSLHYIMFYCVARKTFKNSEKGFDAALSFYKEKYSANIKIPYTSYSPSILFRHIFLIILSIYIIKYAYKHFKTNMENPKVSDFKGTLYAYEHIPMPYFYVENEKLEIKWFQYEISTPDGYIIY